MSATRIATIDDYFKTFGPMHVKKATDLLDPLHLPGRDPVPDLSPYLRQPFDAQAHVVAALVRTLDEQHSAMLAAEMGTGKTLMGIVAADQHARRSRRKGGSNGHYRAIVLCPDHLIMKWKDEIERTLPDVRVTTFDVQGGGCKQLLKDMIALHDRVRGPGRYRKAHGAEWFVIGKDQAKLMPGVSALGSPRKGEGGRGFEHGSSIERLVAFKDDAGRHRTARVRVYRCPRCGTDLVNPRGDGYLDLAQSSRMMNCGRQYGVEVPDPNRRTCGLERWSTRAMQDARPGAIVTRNAAYGAPEKKFLVHTCGEPLWQYVSEPRRWAPALFMSRKLPRLFDYLIADEIHMQKGKTTAQANAFGMLAANARNVLALTGTLIGGYARDVFYLLLRTDARPLLTEGIGWGGEMKFTRTYGRIETTETTRTDPEGRSTISRGRRSLAKKDEATTDERPAPGVMPALFGRHLIGRAVFLALDDLADNLPGLREYIGGPPDEEDDEFWSECAIDMPPELADEYRRVEGLLVARCRELLQQGSMKLLGQLLVATLGYQDLPYGWKAPTGREDHKACGYWETPGNRDPSNWVGVVQPRDLPESEVYPKEAALIEIVEKEVIAGNQVWVYVQMSDKRDLRPRLARLLRERGLDVAILKSGGKGGPRPKDRLAWIEEHGRGVNVIISHPQLVETGVDFFKLGRGAGDGYQHNFNAIVFYETGYNIFTLRQAARRAWRIGQRRDCRVYYLYYKDTGQERAMKLIARKMDAALALDGELSAEGLASMADDRSAAMALARSISEQIEDVDVGRNWSKVRARPAATPFVAAAPDAIFAEDGPVEGLDILHMEAELLSRTLLDYDPEAPAIAADQLRALYEDFDFDPDDLLNDPDLDYDEDEALEMRP